MPASLLCLPWLPSGLYLSGALLAALLTSRRWPLLAAVTRCALAAAVLHCALALFARPHASGAAIGAVSATVALLIAFLGWIIGDYSSRYLRGEPGQTRFVVAYLLTLAAVSAVVASRNLAPMLAAWTFSSASLHHLLTFYRDRPAALVVAHKKFLASRLAEACLLVAATLLYHQWGTLDLSTIAAHAGTAGALPAAADAAATLIALAVLLKCAQLPLHGWLIQVMEAPTPVSALLHAGVVNLGGYVLIRFAALIEASAAARTLLVIVGSLTAAAAGLVMLTRITIKVRLAWSTCSQMGLMVLECGLGLYDLALLHLLAHALYKAHAFLTAGEAVRDGLGRRLTDRDPRAAHARPLVGSLLALGASGALAAGSGILWHQLVHLPTPSWIALALLACGLATLLWRPLLDRAGIIRGLATVAVAAQCYCAWHWLIGDRLAVPSFLPSAILSCWTLAVFLTLYVAQAEILRRPSAGVPARLYDWAYAGLYLDERFTRLAFRLWPARARPDHAGVGVDREVDSLRSAA